MRLKSINLTVNDKPVAATVEPRLQLAEFLREHLLLTGTHLGCEHGICGACTVEIDGQISRSCIVYVVACEGATVRTIEGFDDDDHMVRLRQVFSEEHALQCGYCTPGILITARDIITRLKYKDPCRIREELSGNLCRCTGYVGIVNAVQRVLEEHLENSTTLETTPAGTFVANMGVSRPGSVSQRVEPYPNTIPLQKGSRPLKPKQANIESEKLDKITGLTTLHETFLVTHAPSVVWEFLSDVEQVATCMPGAHLTAPVKDNHVKGLIKIKLGPMQATFAGEADLMRDDARYVGSIDGIGRDKLSSTRAKGHIEYQLCKDEEGASTRVDVELRFALAGPLAQFSRGGLVNALAKKLTAQFATNLQIRLDGHSNLVGVGADQAPVSELKVGSLMFSALWDRVKAFFLILFGR